MFVNSEEKKLDFELKEARAVISAVQAGMSVEVVQAVVKSEINTCIRSGCTQTFRFPYGYHPVKGSKRLWTGTCSSACEDKVDPVSAEFRCKRAGGVTPVHELNQGEEAHET